MKNQFNYLQTYRKRTGVALKDMADILHIDAGNLSRMERGQSPVTLFIILSYKIILNIPVEQLFKNHLINTTKECLRNVLALKESILESMSGPELSKQMLSLDRIIDHLVEVDGNYEK